MDARLVRAAFAAAALLSLGASHRTPNFIVNAPTPQIAKQVGEAAEKYRNDLAVEWLGEAMPNWGQPCPVTLQIGDHLGAGGATSFVFDRGEVFGWQMNIQGPLDRILDSVLPHEVTHTVFATHFRRPLPRWADEGACTTVEHSIERVKHQKMLVAFLRTGRGIPFSQMFAMKEYPQDILPLYAQGHSLSTFLLSQGGKQKYLQFVADGLESEQWVDVTRQHYGFKDLAQLQDTWLDWVRRGSPALKQATATLASNTAAKDDHGQRGEIISSIYRKTDENGNRKPVGQLAAATRPEEQSISPSASQPQVLPSPGDSDRRVVLEWDRQKAAVQPPASSLQPAERSVYDARPTANGTMLR